MLRGKPTSEHGLPEFINPLVTLGGEDIGPGLELQIRFNQPLALVHTQVRLQRAGGEHPRVFRHLLEIRVALRHPPQPGALELQGAAVSLP
jgi:hypothetical protein